MAIPITLNDLLKYPFLPQVREYIAKTDLDFDTIIELEPIRARAKERIESSFSLEMKLNQKPSKHTEIEIASYSVAIMLAAATKDKQLIARFALCEAKQANVFLDQERNRPDLIEEIAKAFEWKMRSDEQGIWIRFSTYLKTASSGRLVHDPKWKLVNRSLEKGWVAISSQELKRLLQEEVKEKIEKSASQEIIDLPPAIRKDVEEIKANFDKNKLNFVEYDLKIYADESQYPPCIARFLKRAKEGQHLSHTERFTLVTYLLHQNVSIDSIVNLFSNVTDFKEEKTRYQVEDLAGKTGGRTEPYTTYNCSTLQSHGVCSIKKDPDQFCRRIRNPLTYHLFVEKKNPKEKEV